MTEKPLGVDRLRPIHERIVLPPNLSTPKGQTMKPGDVVQLKIGGPRMVIGRIFVETELQTAMCSGQHAIVAECHYPSERGTICEAQIALAALKLVLIDNEAESEQPEQNQFLPIRDKEGNTYHPFPPKRPGIDESSPHGFSYIAQRLKDAASAKEQSNPFEDAKHGDILLPKAPEKPFYVHQYPDSDCIDVRRTKATPGSPFIARFSGPYALHDAKDHCDTLNERAIMPL